MKKIVKQQLEEHARHIRLHDAVAEVCAGGSLIWQQHPECLRAAIGKALHDTYGSMLTAHFLGEHEQ